MKLKQLLKPPAFILTPACKISRKNFNLLIETPSKENKTIYTRRISCLVICDPSSITNQALEICSRLNILIMLTNRYGKIISRISPYNYNNYQLLEKQINFNKAPNNLQWAKNIVNKKIINQICYLSKALYRIKNSKNKRKLKHLILKLAVLKRRVENSKNINELLGVEGLTSKMYFSAFNLIIKKNLDIFNWKKRSRRPPRDAINALISFVYSLALQAVELTLNARLLDTRIGILHQGKKARPSLSLDFLDIIRSCCDRFCIALINRGQLNKECFDFSKSKVLLNSKGRKIIIENFMHETRTISLRSKIIKITLLEMKTYLKEICT